MPKLKTGIASIGGKFRLVNTILKYIPYHEFFLSLFCGACWVEINKNRCRYEAFNDLNAEIINYLLMIRQYPKEFDEMKQGVFGLVSQEICNRIVRGELKPKNDFERAYFFYYLNKLTFGGDVKKVGDHAHQSGIQNPCINSIRETDLEKAKERFEYETKGYGGLSNTQSGQKRLCKDEIKKAKDEYQTKGFGGMINTHAFPQKGKGRIDKNEIEQAKATYAGINITRALGNSGNKRDRAKWQKKFKDNVEKASYRGIHTIADTTKASRARDIEKTKKQFKDNSNFFGISSKVAIDVQDSKERYEEVNVPYGGLSNIGVGTFPRKNDVENAKDQYQTISHDAVVGKKSQYKGINPVTTRPYTNFDRGLLTPIQPEVIERLRFVNLTCYDFRKVYKLFYNAFYVRKGLTRECFIYSDSPFPGTEHYYGNLFKKEDHQDLIDIALKTPFNFMLSIGGECEMYLEQLKDWTILPVKVKYSTDANHQYDRKEYIITNYEIKDVAKMSQDCQSNLTKFMK